MKIYFALSILLLSSLCASAQRSGKDYAVFFYVTDFQPRWASLPETKPEALALKNELESSFGFTCEVVANPGKQNILDKISAYNELLTPNDQVLFFFSMHGHFENAADRGYLVARDGLEIDKYGTTYLSYDDLNAYLALCKAKHVLLALDACHSGAFAMMRNKNRPDAPVYSESEDCTQRVNKLLKYTGRQYCTSGNKDAKTPAKSLFANRFLEALRKGGENGIVTYDDLVFYLAKVDNPKPESGSFKGHEPGGDFVFVRKNSCITTKDRDGDGIADSADQCPEDYGISENKGCPENIKTTGSPDTDYDGVPDVQDKCPDKFGTKANAGCPETGVGNDIADADSDGVPDERDACPTEYGTVNANGCPDRDKDGVPDKSDKCKTLAGEVKWQGCPDSDGDGIPDHEDLCPLEKGLLAEKGCPPADSDQDGVPDKSDLCKDKKGEMKWQGCPDTDGDGLPDHEDQCPNKKGLFSDKGCPPADRDTDGVPDKSDKCPDVAGEDYLEGCPETQNITLKNRSTETASQEEPVNKNAGSVLFTVHKTPVSASEFTYIYRKTQNENADFSEKSLREYMALYVDFKLKVQKARDMHLDTLTSIKNELEGYRTQLSKSYLEDRELTDKLAREAFERMQQDVDISHIFIACDKNATAADTLKSYSKAVQLLQSIKNGKSFETVAAESSEDKSSREKQGRLGFVTALLPDGYYDMEKAVYAAKPGALLGPIRSNNGYHLVKVNGFRPARGEMEVAQILIRKSTTGTDKSKMRIDSVYALLRAGRKWDDMCALYSEDKTTAAKGGYIGFVGINKYQRSFEDAAFALAKDGDYSVPAETTIGWHIIKRISSRPIGTFEQKKKSVTDLVKRDSRIESAKQAFISRIKKENAFVEYPKVLNAWAAKQTAELFHSADWKPATTKQQDVLLKYNQNRTYTVADFEDYCARASRDRMSGAGTPVQETVNKLYKAWSDEITMQFEEKLLDKKYPEFHALLREYEDGVMLFEALKNNVWDKANTDSIGREQYYNTNLYGKYKWDERARVTFYTLKTTDSDVLKKVTDFAAGHDSDEVVKKFNKKEQILTTIEKLYEKGKNQEIDKMWKAGSISNSKQDNQSGTVSFVKVEQIVPPVSKTIAEARGYVIADYQDYLEKQWIASLRKEYKVTIDETVFNSLVRK